MQLGRTGPLLAVTKKQFADEKSALQSAIHCSIKFNATGARVLVDPWLVGELTFLEQAWLYRGKKRVIGRSVTVNVAQVAQETDVVVLTQVGARGWQGMVGVVRGVEGYFIGT